MKQSKILKKLLNNTTITDKTVFVISISGGKDSKATLIVSIPELLKYVQSSQIKVVFCDTGWEKKSTMREIESIKSRLYDLNIEFNILKNEDYPNGMLDLIKHKKAFPTRDIKTCTQLLKMIPAVDYYKSLNNKGLDVITLVGKRRDESKDRADISDIDYYKYKNWKYTIFHPIADWTETDVFSLLDETWGIPEAYFNGNSRVGCDECFQADLKSISLMSNDKIELMSELETYVSQYHKDINPTFFFRRNSSFPDGFAPIKDIVAYARQKQNFNNYTFHTRALKFLVSRLSQKVVRYKFVQYGYVPDKTNFSKYCNGVLPVPQSMQFHLELILSKNSTVKERGELLRFQFLEELDKEDENIKCDCESYNLL